MLLMLKLGDCMEQTGDWQCQNGAYYDGVTINRQASTAMMACIVAAMSVITPSVKISSTK